MTQDFEVTAEELVRVLSRRGIPLPSEIGAFVVLEACEKLIDRPAQLSTRDIFITEQGDVECAVEARLQSEAAAAGALLGVLAELLVCAAPGVPNMLLDLVEHGPNDRALTLGLLRSELEACLLPLNRGATRRVLSRLVREVRKSAPAANVRANPPPASEPEPGDVDATFDDLMGESVPPPAAASQARSVPVGRALHDARERLRERDTRERALHEAADASSTPPVPDRSLPTPVPRAGSRTAARRRASDSTAEPSRKAPEATTHARADSYRAARESAFRGYSSQAPAEPETASRRPKRPVTPSEEHTVMHTQSQIEELTGEPLGRPRRGRAAHGGEPRGRSGASEDDEVSSLRDNQGADGRRRGDLEQDERGLDADGGSSARRGRRRIERAEARRAEPRGSGKDALDDPLLEAQSARGRVGMWVFIASTAAAVALLLGYFALGREQAQSALGFLKPSEPAQQTKAAAPPVRREYGDLRVNSKPDRAQVLLLIGPGPALATDIPVGVAQEFVAIAENHRPARALLPADAVWDELDGQPRYELAIQARPLADGAGSRGRPTDGLGATLLPQDVGTPRGRLGSVRVVTTPRAAHVYQLIGFTPDVHVDNLPLDHPYEILVYLEGKGGVQKHIEPSDFHMENGKRVASLDVQL